MIESWKEFLHNKSAFVRVIRALSLGLSAAIMTGDANLPTWVATISAMLAGGLSAGERNPKSK